MLKEKLLICSYASVEEVLKRAHVPPRHGVYIEREEMIEKIREQLYKLKDEDGYDLHAHLNLSHCTRISV